MPVPVISIFANGVDVTGNLAAANMNVVITDSEGITQDTLQIQLDDVGGSIIAPSTGARLNVRGGYEGRIRDFGIFVVDGVQFAGWPQTISINAKAVAALSDAKQREPKAYPARTHPTYGDIFRDIAGKIGLQLEISAELQGIPNPYEARAEEGGLEFLVRIGEKINATVTVKSQRLVVVAKGQGRAVSGGLLDQVAIRPGFNLLSYQVSEKDEPKHSEVEATYYDRQKNSRETVTAQTGLQGPRFLMRNPMQSKEEAEKAAEAQAKNLLRASGDATFDINGEPFVQSEAYAHVSGVRPRVDGLWRIKTATHQFSADGPYTTSLVCEVPSE